MILCDRITAIVFIYKSLRRDEEITMSAVEPIMKAAGFSLAEIQAAKRLAEAS